MTETEFKNLCMKEFDGNTIDEFGEYYLKRLLKERTVDEYMSVWRLLNN